MRNRSILATAAACTLALVAGTAAACGESLFRVGKGVSFREYVAPLPGAILVVAKSEAELMMVERLAAAGHDIHVVAEPEQIRDELAEHEFDIVLAYFSQRDIVSAQTADTSAYFLPVAMDGTNEIEAARTFYERSLSNEDSVKQFLKTIHRTLKARS